MSNVSIGAEYCVPPMLVKSLATQCAAQFINGFRSNSDQHIKDVIQCGLRGSGGLVDEVEYWMDNCCEDAREFDGGNGYWDVAVMGPWTYGDLAPKDVAAIVWKHAKGWKLQQYREYGYTVGERSNFNAAVARV